MCEWKKHGDTRIDPCMKRLVEFINKETNFVTLMSCCGHGKYQPSIVMIDTRTAEFCNAPQELFSNTWFEHNQKRFYKRDKEGYYYIPEILGGKN